MSDKIEPKILEGIIKHTLDKPTDERRFVAAKDLFWSAMDAVDAFLNRPPNAHEMGDRVLLLSVIKRANTKGYAAHSRALRTTRLVEDLALALALFKDSTARELDLKSVVDRTMFLAFFNLFERE